MNRSRTPAPWAPAARSRSAASRPLRSRPANPRASHPKTLERQAQARARAWTGSRSDSTVPLCRTAPLHQLFRQGTDDHHELPHHSSSTRVQDKEPHCKQPARRSHTASSLRVGFAAAASTHMPGDGQHFPGGPSSSWAGQGRDLNHREGGRVITQFQGSSSPAPAPVTMVWPSGKTARYSKGK